MATPEPSPDPDPRQIRLEELARRIGHAFRDQGLLERALCHSSMGNVGKDSYERLEFLGDSVLGFIVSDHLFRAAPDVSEGALTDRRARIVSREPLAEAARRLQLASYLEAGRGLRDADIESSRIQADLVEAVLGAVYLDGGVRAARRFVRKHILSHHRPARLVPSAPRDPKSRLLHHTQMRGLGQPSYRLDGTSGPEHELVFTVTVLVQDIAIAAGSARSKQAAEMEAAAAALEILRQREGDGEATERQSAPE